MIKINFIKIGMDTSTLSRGPQISQTILEFAITYQFIPPPVLEAILWLDIYETKCILLNCVINCHLNF